MPTWLHWDEGEYYLTTNNSRERYNKSLEVENNIKSIVNKILLLKFIILPLATVSCVFCGCGSSFFTGSGFTGSGVGAGVSS